MLLQHLNQLQFYISISSPQEVFLVMNALHIFVQFQITRWKAYYDEATTKKIICPYKSAPGTDKVDGGGISSFPSISINAHRAICIGQKNVSRSFNYQFFACNTKITDRGDFRIRTLEIKKNTSAILNSSYRYSQKEETTYHSNLVYRRLS